MIEETRAEADTPLVVQVSRWDRLKDPLGVMKGFASYVAPASDADLVLAGPSVEAVADDPEGMEVFSEAQALWERLPAKSRRRIHLACLPMDDGEENAAMVNALQRHAAVVVQKSIAEGFGLTVSEAMWKERPVVASRVGGIQDQIVHEESGLLIDDPSDGKAFGTAVRRLLEDDRASASMGEAARERVRKEFLAPRQLGQYAELIEALT
jgi:trehalose synthase